MSAQPPDAAELERRCAEIEGLPTLSPTMCEAYDYAQANGGKLTRYAGGFWCGRSGREGYSFGTSTVEALVKRKVAHYTQFKESHGRSFPIEMTTLPIPEPACRAVVAAHDSRDAI